VGRDGKGYSFDLGKRRREIFLQMGLDNQITGQPVGQITHWPSRIELRRRPAICPKPIE
jgi:hypothetical protein